jgi:tetratricopeptide (TPR) repeat protein
MNHKTGIHIILGSLLFQSFILISVFRFDFIDTPLPVKNERPPVSDKARLDTLAVQARKYLATKSILPAKQYIAEAFDLAKRKNLDIPYNLYWAKAELQALQRDFSGAYMSMEQTVKILNKTDRYQEIAEAGLIFGRLLSYIGEFNRSLETFNNILALAIDKQLKGILPDCYRSMADVYVTIGNREKERECVMLMMEASKAENNADFLARSYFRMGQLKSDLDSDFAGSNRYYQEALQLRKQRGDSALFPLIMGRISWNYYLLKELDTALRYFDLTLQEGLRQKNYANVANAYGNMGTIYRDKKIPEKALYYYGVSTAYAMINKDWYTLAWVNKDMSDMFQQSGDYKKAYESYLRYKSYNDSVNQQKYSIGLADARIRYEADAKAKELQLVSLKVNHQRYYIFGISGFCLLVIIIGGLLFRQSKLTARRQISEMNRQISEITQANLRQQMNPHFIFNTLNSIQYYMYQHDKIAVNNYLTKFSSLMRKTLENSQHTAIPLKEELDALELYLELESLRFKEKFDYAITVDDEIDLLLYKIPTMLLQPYVENAIGHGLINKEGKGSLKIDILLDHDYLRFTIEDNGIGREEAMKIKMSREKNHPSLGTRITESRMELANAVYGTRMKVHYADLHDDHGKASGTRVEIQIPIFT